jgi:hypothetical protein
MSIRCIYTPPTEIQSLLSMLANFDTTGRTGQYKVTAQREPLRSHRTLGSVRSTPTERVLCKKILSGSLLDSMDARQPASSAAQCNVRSTRHWSTTVHAATVRVPVRPVDVAPLLHTPITDRTHPYVWCLRLQRPVHANQLHSLPIQVTLWMVLIPFDLRANPELPSAKFNKCAPHLKY